MEEPTPAGLHRDPCQVSRGRGAAPKEQGVPAGGTRGFCCASRVSRFSRPPLPASPPALSPYVKVRTSVPTSLNRGEAPSPEAVCPYRTGPTSTHPDRSPCDTRA